MLFIAKGDIMEKNTIDILLKNTIQYHSYTIMNNSDPKNTSLGYTLGSINVSVAAYI